MRFDQPPVVRVSLDEDTGPPTDWSAGVPAVRQLLSEGLDLPTGVTFLVGENGSGKSTVIEAVARAYGLNPEGGTINGGPRTHASESELWRSLRVQRGVGASHWGFFLRAETMHAWYTFKAGLEGDRDPRFHAMSHGESFLAVAASRFDSSGFYCLDEPEAALSFSSTLSFIRTLHDVAADGAQVLCATHSPVLCSLPGARILEFGDWGYRETDWDDLDLAAHWRTFLNSPGRYLRHVLADD